MGRDDGKFGDRRGMDGHGEYPSSVDRRRPPREVQHEQLDAGTQLAWIESLLDGLPHAMALLTSDARFLWANQGFLELIHRSLPEIRGSRVTILAGPYAEKAEGRVILDLVENGNGILTTVAFTREGMPFPCEFSVARPPSPGPAAMVLTAKDLSELERLRTEMMVKAESAQREREIIRATTEALEQGVIVVDDSERLIVLNAAASKLLDLPVDQSHGHSLTDLPLPSGFRGRWLAFLAGAKDSESSEVLLERGGESLRLQADFRRVRSIRRVPMGSLCILYPKEDSLDASACASMARLGHDLRTPLTSVQGFVDALLGEPDIDVGTRTEFLEIVAKESRRMGRVIAEWSEVAQEAMERK